MDITVDPCTDFFTFSCGGWIEKETDHSFCQLHPEYFDSSADFISPTIKTEDKNRDLMLQRSKVKESTINSSKLLNS
jgi:hypothetical protein